MTVRRYESVRKMASHANPEIMADRRDHALSLDVSVYTPWSVENNRISADL